jgi:hypothetical protein
MCRLKDGRLHCARPGPRLPGWAETQDAIDGTAAKDDDDGVCAARLSSGEPVWAVGRGYACAVLPHSQATTRVRRRKMTLRVLRSPGALRETSNVAGVAVVLRTMEKQCGATCVDGVCSSFKACAELSGSGSNVR